MKQLVDTLGRKLNVQVDHSCRRVIVSRSDHMRLTSVVATFTVKQALHMAAILLEESRHLLDPDA